MTQDSRRRVWLAVAALASFVNISRKSKGGHDFRGIENDLGFHRNLSNGNRCDTKDLLWLGTGWGLAGAYVAWSGCPCGLGSGGLAQLLVWADWGSGGMVWLSL